MDGIMGIAVGIVIGSFGTIFGLALCSSASDRDDWKEEAEHDGQ